MQAILELADDPDAGEEPGQQRGEERFEPEVIEDDDIRLPAQALPRAEEGDLEEREVAHGQVAGIDHGDATAAEVERFVMCFIRTKSLLFE